VAINSIPQQEVANGSGQIEFFLARPITLSSEVAKNLPYCHQAFQLADITFKGFFNKII
jgi:hypothetical protein